MDILSEGKRVFDVEIAALNKTKAALDETFVTILKKIKMCEGKVVLTGIGKPGHIAKKLAATFSSLGTPAFYLHPAEAMHGDLGMIDEKDVIIAISYSGESDEIVKILPNIKMIGAFLIAISGNANSTLCKYADIAQILPKFDEACYLGLAPTSSTTSVLCYGDALAVVASGLSEFKKEDFGKYHPAGALGKRLVMRVADVMAKGNEVPSVESGSTLVDAIEEMSRKGLGSVAIVDADSFLLGIITDGDLRRFIKNKIDLYTVKVNEVMTKNPKTCLPEILAAKALKLIKDYDINNLIVVDKAGKLQGTITWQQIIKTGIVL
ncbi:arabinose-5-phosphate isomerase [Eubacterium oxidoreducens]|uniref:Arabinose-5-phosphate isomerase n=2 Tax=Eubacterium oxidoreducens TaxID=1732 RepID=A0A1G6CBF8_EUBOX|nr:arabinose-5-phosphate isomerase [Eubacterium oxidoreducens]